MTASTPNPATPEQLTQIGHAAAQLIEPGQTVGLGSGRASHAFVRALAARLAREKFSILGIPTSNSTEKLARELGIPLGSLETISTVDIAVDGADEVTPDFDLLKGGGGDLLREKVVASISRRFVIVVGHEKLVPCLGDKFPVFIEVVAFALPVVVRHLQTLGGQAAPRLTPDGKLFLTDKDGFIPCLLAGEILATHQRDPGEIYRQFTSEFGESVYERVEAPANTAQKALLAKLSPSQVKATQLAGEAITAILTKAPGNNQPIGGLKVATANGWFAARPSGTEAIYKIYAESFKGREHLNRLITEAQQLVGDVVADAGS